MNPKEFKEEMQKINEIKDIEKSHSEADKLMSELLVTLGYQEGIEVYRKMRKWYS